METKKQWITPEVTEIEINSNNTGSGDVDAKS
jgi:hypothetical protein